VEHIAIDLGGRKSQVCVRDETGAILEERRMSTEALQRFLEGRAKGRVILETCAEAFVVADAARAAGHEVRVVPSTLVRSLGVGARKVKTDQRDARVTSEVSTRIDLPSVYVPPSEARQHKALCSSREALVSARTKLVNHCRGWVRTQVPGSLHALRSRQPSSFPSRMRSSGLALPAHILSVLVMIENLNAQIQALDKELEKIAKADEICTRLMSVPGVGPVTALRFVAAVCEIERFDHSHSLQSYFGLVPGERSSGDKRQRTGLTKAGSPHVRWLLIQAAWSAWRTRPHDAMVRWAQQVAMRRGKNVAIAALARKMAGILYALWRDRAHYDPTLGSSYVVDQLATSENELRAAIG
jgi:transposase